MHAHLNDTQRALLDEVIEYWGRFGIPPAVTDLADTLQCSRQTVHRSLRALESHGHLEPVERRGRVYWRLASRKPLARDLVPLLGEVAAGFDLYAEENVRGWIPFGAQARDVRLFALEVVGDSMIGIGIFSGDRVIVRQQSEAENGDLVVALVDGREATVKLFFREDAERVRLQSMNPGHEPLVVAAERVLIRGKVIQVQRDLES